MAWRWRWGPSVGVLADEAVSLVANLVDPALGAVPVGQDAVGAGAAIRIVPVPDLVVERGAVTPHKVCLLLQVIQPDPESLPEAWQEGGKKVTFLI